MIEGIWKEWNGIFSMTERTGGFEEGVGSLLLFVKNQTLKGRSKNKWRKKTPSPLLFTDGRRQFYKLSSVQEFSLKDFHPQALAFSKKDFISEEMGHWVVDSSCFESK